MRVYQRIKWLGDVLISSCPDCGSAVSDQGQHDRWHADLEAHSHHTLSVIGGPSAGQTKQFGPRPAITTAKPDLT